MINKQPNFAFWIITGTWLIGVSVNHYQKFKRLQRDINLISEYLYRNIFSEERYIIGVVSLHDALKEISKMSVKSSSKRMNFCTKLFRHRTSQSLMREYAGIIDKQELIPNPIRWGKVLGNAIGVSSQKVTTVIWERGKQQVSENNALFNDVKQLLDNAKIPLKNLSKSECFVDTTQLQLCWPNIPSFREHTFSGKVIGFRFIPPGIGSVF